MKTLSVIILALILSSTSLTAKGGGMGKGNGVNSGSYGTMKQIKQQKRLKDGTGLGKKQRLRDGGGPEHQQRLRDGSGLGKQNKNQNNYKTSEGRESKNMNRYKNTEGKMSQNKNSAGKNQ